jgi:hypothetical protein
MTWPAMRDFSEVDLKPFILAVRKARSSQLLGQAVRIFLSQHKSSNWVGNMTVVRGSPLSFGLIGTHILNDASNAGRGVHLTLRLP